MAVILLSAFFPAAYCILQVLEYLYCAYINGNKLSEYLVGISSRKVRC